MGALNDRRTPPQASKAASLAVRAALHTVSPMTMACISFDWGDTLASNATMPYDLVQKRAIQSLGQSLRRLGGLLPDDWRQICQAQLRMHWRDSVDLQKNPDHKEFDYQALVEGWVSVTGVQRDQAVEAIANYFIRCSEIIDPFGTVEPVLATLKASGYRLGICLHVAWPEDACQAWFVNTGWDRYLDFYSLSSSVGRIKPHPAHYGDLLAKAGCLAEEIVHVGDHPLRVSSVPRLACAPSSRPRKISTTMIVSSCEPDAVIAHVNELPALLTTHPCFSEKLENTDVSCACLCLPFGRFSLCTLASSFGAAAAAADMPASRLERAPRADWRCLEKHRTTI